MLYNMKEGNILEVYVGVSNHSKEQTKENIEDFIGYVSSGVLNAVIYIFENGDVLQFCGKNNLFRVESVKIYGKTPNIRILKMREREQLSGKLNFLYCGEEKSENLSLLIPGEVLSSIIEYSLSFPHEEGWNSYLTHLCDKFELYIDYCFMSKKGFTKVAIKESKL